MTGAVVAWLVAAPPPAAACEDELKVVGRAIQTYYLVNEALPRKLSDLYKSGQLPYLDQFVCASSGRKVSSAATIDQESDFELLSGGGPQDPIVVMRDHVSPRLTLLADGTVVGGSAEQPPAATPPSGSLPSPAATGPAALPTPAPAAPAVTPPVATAAPPVAGPTTPPSPPAPPPAAPSSTPSPAAPPPVTAPQTPPPPPAPAPRAAPAAPPARAPAGGPIWRLKNVEQTEPKRVEGRGNDFIEYTPAITFTPPETLRIGDPIEVTASATYSYGAGEDGTSLGRPKSLRIAIDVPNGNAEEEFHLIPNTCRRPRPTDLPPPMPQTGSVGPVSASGRLTESDASTRRLTIAVSVYASVYCLAPEASGSAGLRAEYEQVAEPAAAVPTAAASTPPPVPDAGPMPASGGGSAVVGSGRATPVWAVATLASLGLGILGLAGAIALLRTRGRAVTRAGHQAAAAAPRRPVRLAVTYPDGRTTTVVVDAGRRATIGRAAENDLRLEDPTISGRHAQIAWSGTELVVTDLGSANGTRVNDRRVARAAVRPGDEIRCGAVGLKVLGES